MRSTMKAELTALDTVIVEIEWCWGYGPEAIMILGSRHHPRELTQMYLRCN
jgi:hypothetical protein